MQIKLPPAYDVSHWKEIQDFTLVSPRPVLFITKATEAVSFVDEKFVRFWNGMKQIGVVRGAFHFHRKAYNPVEQAQHFVNTIKPYVVDKDILILDVEEGGETAAQLKAWFEYVRGVFPRNQVLLYSRKNLLDMIPMFLKRFIPNVIGASLDRLLFGEHPLNAIQMTMEQREYFKGIPTWPAGYPLNPDLYSSIPSFYVPDQTKFGPPWLWQYSGQGMVSGIEGSVDLNLIAPVFLALIDGGVIEPPPPGEIGMYHGKATGNITIRTGPGTSYPVATISGISQYVFKDDLLEATESVNGFWRLSKIMRAGTNVLLPPIAWCGTGYVLIEPPPVEPPPAPVPVESLKVEVTRFNDGTKKVMVDGDEWKPSTGGA